MSVEMMTGIFSWLNPWRTKVEINRQTSVRFFFMKKSQEGVGFGMSFLISEKIQDYAFSIAVYPALSQSFGL